MADKDIISKSLLKRLLLDMARYLCNMDLLDAKLLSTEHQRIEDRRADLIAKVQPVHGNPFILHLEVQNNNDSRMTSRMLRYLSDIQLAHPNNPIHQCLIYIGAERLTMSNSQTGPQIDYRYDQIDMRSIGYRDLYDSDNPDALILAILCDFQGESARDVIEHILTKLQTLTGHNEKMRREYLQMLEILADNRHLNIDIQETYDMLQINIENLPSYRLAMGKGLEKGMEKGLEKATRLIALKLLRKDTPVSTIAEVTGLTEAEIQQMAADNTPQ